MKIQKEIGFKVENGKRTETIYEEIEDKSIKLSAVEFLVNKLKSQGLLIGEPTNLVAVREAKEMEEQQLKSYGEFCVAKFNGFESVSLNDEIFEEFKNK